MKRLTPLFALVLGCAAAAWAAPPARLTTLHAIHSLSHAEAAKGLPVAFEATVTYRRAGDTTLFVQDADEGIYVGARGDIILASGDRVLVRGKALDSFRPIVIAESVTLLHHGALPSPVPATFDELIHAQRDCMLVTVHAKVRSADLELNAFGKNDVQMTLISDGSAIDTYVDSEDASSLHGLLDAEVEVTGVASARFDGKMQQTGVGLNVPSLADVKIVKRADASPESLPVTQMDEIITSYRVNNLSQRVHVHGTITYYQPGSALFLQNGTKSIWIMTIFQKPLRIGDEADVTGFPEVHDGFLALSGGEIQERPVYTPIVPKPVAVSELAASKHIFDLISIEGQVVMEVRENSQDEYVLMANGQDFSAIYRHPSVRGLELLPMNHVRLGSRVRVSGICILESSNSYNGDVPFNILLRTPDDISVIARPTLLNVRNLMILVGLLLATMIALGLRGWAIEYRVRKQTTTLALIEHRRSRILEDINGARPLAEIVEEITELVSFMLRGAPCWCQIADGARLGNCPPKLTDLRVLEANIPARSGPALGTLFTAFDPHAKPRAKEPEALAMAVGLTALAIETRHLYTDLLRRSEFDLLTDIHNRFSLDKRLNELVEEARLKAGIFGLIYVDLDRFKQVNDEYGHQAGDLFLQEVALRMKHQLRSVDMLARLGGDEFAVLLPQVRSRAKVEEIAHRLELCFDDPFAVGEHSLQGSASIGIALYPEDATTADSLLSAADAAMYISKHSGNEVDTARGSIRTL
jgi:diguanylate cyclase (GGDEF)-like protein